MTRKSHELSDWIGDLQRRARSCVDAALERPNPTLSKFRSLLARTTGNEVTESEYRDICAEALAWMIVYAKSESKHAITDAVDRTAVYSPFVVELLSVLRSSDDSSLLADLGQGVSRDSGSDPLFLYESYLGVRDPSRRAERGVFYTPRVIARHIVERLDNVLRDVFGLADGLADTTTWSEMRKRWPGVPLTKEPSGDEPFVRILDPAAGTGVFLLEVIDRIHRTLADKWRAENRFETESVALWNDYVPSHLLPRMFAVELMPTPNVISQLAVAQKLADTGYEFHRQEQLRFSIADTLLEPDARASLPLFRNLDENEPAAGAFTVVLGNPPFRGISSNSTSWIGKLLRGIGPGGQSAASYYEVDGEPLGERKLWLQDDYVKFMRFAQWQIEKTGTGVVGFVTNHGYLDNATFRGMRHAMLETFDQVDVFDLHGNRKKNKSAPDGGKDEGMFDIDQGVAIGIFSRTMANDAKAVTHREVWGSREAKTRAIAECDRVPATRITPQPPNYLLVPVGVEKHPAYEAGLALNEVMPVNSTAVVTARDGFVVGFDEACLGERMRAFCDTSISDDEIRSRFFTNSRSTKYPPGDTRGWKLDEARRRMMQEPDWTRLLRPCLYRPFDRRVIFWADWMIDWPRPDVTRHLLARPNIALVARRQMPPTGTCNFFWITDTIALDGLLRSDNRGSESIFPLWLATDSAAGEVNLDARFVAAIAAGLGLTWDPRDESTAENRFGPIDVLHYIYGLFNAPSYRQRYSENLRREFPRVLIPRCRSVWTAFRELGARLTMLHLSNPNSAGDSSDESGDTVQLEAGYPKYASEQIWLGKKGPALPASDRVWNYHAGTHQVCRKWLRDRGAYDANTLRCYQRIIALVAETLEISDSLDTAVANAGGWEAVFSA